MGETVAEVKAQANSISNGSAADSTVNAGSRHGEIESDVQTLLAEMQTSFKSFSETVFAKSSCSLSAISLPRCRSHHTLLTNVLVLFVL